MQLKLLRVLVLLLLQFLSDDSASSGNRLYVTLGDGITAKYDDHTLPEPYSKSDSQIIDAIIKVDSSILLINRLKSTPPIISDGFGNSLASVSSENLVQIVGSITNISDHMQEFVCLFQIKDDANIIQSIPWVEGQISPEQDLNVSQS